MTQRRVVITTSVILIATSLFIGCQTQPRIPAIEPKVPALSQAAADAETRQQAARAERERKAAEEALREAQNRVMVAHAKIKRLLASTPFEVISVRTNNAAIQIQQLTIKRKELNKFLDQITTQQQQLQAEQKADQFLNQEARDENTAKLQQATLGRQILASELNSVNESLNEWSTKFEDRRRLMLQHEALRKELEIAEADRRAAQEAVEATMD